MIYKNLISTLKAQNHMPWFFLTIQQTLIDPLVKWIQFHRVAQTLEENCFTDMVIFSYCFHSFITPLKRAEHFRNQLLTQETDSRSRSLTSTTRHVHQPCPGVTCGAIKDASVSSDKAFFLNRHQFMLLEFLIIEIQKIVPIIERHAIFSTDNTKLTRLQALNAQSNGYWQSISLAPMAGIT